MSDKPIQFEAAIVGLTVTGSNEASVEAAKVKLLEFAQGHDGEGKLVATKPRRSSDALAILQVHLPVTRRDEFVSATKALATIGSDVAINVNVWAETYTAFIGRAGITPAEKLTL